MSIELNGTTGITTPAETVSGAVTAATVTATGLISGATNYTGFKNRIINGNMAIDQRNAGAAIATPNGYTLDRWNAQVNANGKLTAQQNQGSVTPPTGFANYLGFTSSSAYSLVSGDYFLASQSIEGFNVADLGWGTASASSATLSFWVRSSLTGTFGGVVRNSAANRSYPFTYTISASNTWEQKTVTIVGETTGTWLTTNGAGIQLSFGLGVGTTYSGAAGAWSASNLLSATGATSVVGTNGATFYITGVQLEKGSTATSFDYRPYGTELALCQRYLPAIRSSSINNGTGFTGAIASATVGYITCPLSVKTRVPATGIVSSTNLYFCDGVAIAGIATSQVLTTAGAVPNTSVDAIGLTIGITGGTAGRGLLISLNAATDYIYFTGCEL